MKSLLSINLKKLLVLIILAVPIMYMLALLRVQILGRLPRTMNRKPINTTAPVSKTPDYAQLEQQLRAADPTAGKSPSELESLYFQLIHQQHVECPHYRRIGATGEGGWDVCFTGPFDIRKSRPHCVAFSFGVDNVFAYDDDLADGYNCRVFMFDPSMTGVDDHRRRPSSWFYRTGLAANNTVLPANGWRMRSLCSLMDELAHKAGLVDILKLDVEHWEWHSLAAALHDGCLTRVKQLMLESHTTEMLYEDSNYAKFVSVFVGLFRLGFRTWRTDENPLSRYYYSSYSGQYRACCYEHYLINTNFLVAGELV